VYSVVLTAATRETVFGSVDLTADQRTALEPILKDQRDRQSVIAQDSILSPEDRHKSIQKVNESTAAKIQALLTDEQKVKFQEMQQKQQERNGEQQTPPASPPPEWRQVP
jgi:protein CpxP